MVSKTLKRKLLTLVEFREGEKCVAVERANAVKQTKQKTKLTATCGSTFIVKGKLGGVA